MTYASHVGISADVLIRADGGHDGLALKGFPPTGKGRDSAILIDVADDFDARSASASKSRTRYYLSRGWLIGTGQAPTSVESAFPRGPRP
jgi:hypothetical protein